MLIMAHVKDGISLRLSVHDKHDTVVNYNYKFIQIYLTLSTHRNFNAWKVYYYRKSVSVMFLICVHAPLTSNASKKIVAYNSVVYQLKK